MIHGRPYKGFQKNPSYITSDYLSLEYVTWVFLHFFLVTSVCWSKETSPLRFSDIWKKRRRRGVYGQIIVAQDCERSLVWVVGYTENQQQQQHNSLCLQPFRTLLRELLEKAFKIKNFCFLLFCMDPRGG
jgi:hypothetical protein